MAANVLPATRPFKIFFLSVTFMHGVFFQRRVVGKLFTSVFAVELKGCRNSARVCSLLHAIVSAEPGCPSYVA